MAEDLTRGAPRYRDRVGHGVRRTENWLQAARFVVVGVSGLVANVAAYAFAVHVLGVDFRLAAVVGFVAGVGNNFFWHRTWTFGARHGHAGSQAARFVVVYGVTFFVALGILQLLVDAGTARVVAQTVSQLLVTPLNFLGHKYWSFDD